MNWQNDPTTDKQIRLLQSLRYGGIMPTTKGEASKIISNLLFAQEMDRLFGDYDDDEEQLDYYDDCFDQTF